MTRLISSEWLTEWMHTYLHVQRRFLSVKNCPKKFQFPKKAKKDKGFNTENIQIANTSKKLVFLGQIFVGLFSLVHFLFWSVSQKKKTKILIGHFQTRVIWSVREILSVKEEICNCSYIQWNAITEEGKRGRGTGSVDH